MKIAFMYAGQGAQRIGMGTDFYLESEVYKNAVDKINSGNKSSLKKLMDDGPEDLLRKTENTQPAMAAFAIGVTEVLRNEKIHPNVVCGLSIGEYGALYASDVFSAYDYMEVVRYRGKVMAEASKDLTCVMSAIIGLSDEKLCDIISAMKDRYVTISNFNCTGQYVITGEEDAVEECEKICINAGAKQCVRLNVSGPFHTKYMEEASVLLRNKLNTIKMETPKIPLLLNTTGDFYVESMNLKDVMQQQIKSGVQFEREIRNMLDYGIDTFIEIGPGKTLGSFVKRTAKAYQANVSVYSLDTYDDYKKLIFELHNKGKEIC